MIISRGTPLREPKFNQSSLSYFWENNVPYSRVEHSRNQVRKAGEILIGKKVGDVDASGSILDNWRASHSYPLQLVRKALQKRAVTVDTNALTVQRLKTRTSILAKLQRHRMMKLSTMQDIGGCRAIVETFDQLLDLIKIYSEITPSTCYPVDSYNYLDGKADGYRGFHIVDEFQSPDNSGFNGIQIEIQLRTRLQHAWATATEVVSTFTNQNLKAGVGSDDWKRFFFLSSGLLGGMENRVLSQKFDLHVMMPELVHLWNTLQVPHLLGGFMHTFHPMAQTYVPGANHFLLYLDAREKSVRIDGFRPRELDKAILRYNMLDKRHASDPMIHTVLVAMDDLVNLRRAYPNYYADTTEFILKVSDGIKVWKKMKI